MHMQPSAFLATLLIFILAETCDAQWIRTNGPSVGSINRLAVSPRYVLEGGIDGTGIFSSTDRGSTWVAASTGLDNGFVGALYVSDTTFYAGIDGLGWVYRSTNGGATWTAMNLVPLGKTVEAILVLPGRPGLSPSRLYAATEGNGIAVTTDSGATWRSVNTGLTVGELYVTSLAAIDTTLFAGLSSGVFRSTDYGMSWFASDSGMTSRSVRSLAVMTESTATGGPTLFAGSDGVFRSTNQGRTWTDVSAGIPPGTLNGPPGPVRNLVVRGRTLIAGTLGAGVLVSGDKGMSWTEVNTGLTDSVVYALAASETDIYAGPRGGIVWRRSLSEIITSVPESHEPEVPKQLLLEQNYPNPFNPSTTIRFTVPHRMHVRLTLFNVLGQTVAELVNEEIDAGTHEVKLESRNSASGILFCRLQGGKSVEVRKLILSK